MGDIITLDAHAEQLTELTLIQLFEEAEAFGRINVHSSSDAVGLKRYHVSIEFQTIPGTDLKAGSEFRMEIHDAFIMAITRARTIVSQFSKQPS